MAPRRKRKRKTKPTKAELSAAAKRIAAAEARRRRLQAKNRQKTETERQRSAEYLDDELVQRKDGKGPARKFREGNPGRPPGAANIIPTTVRASVKAIIERVVHKHGDAIENAIVKGIKGDPNAAAKFIKIAAEYTDGKPPQTLTLNKSWNEDELEEAHDRLASKFETLFGRLDATLAPEPVASSAAAPAKATDGS